MKFVIRSVDQEPEDLPAQLPLRGRLLRRISGPPRRPEDRLAELSRPVSWADEGVTRTIRFVVLTARWAGLAIGPGAKLPVNLWYVVDESVVTSASFESPQAVFVAVGEAKVSRWSWLPF